MRVSILFLLLSPIAGTIAYPLPPPWENGDGKHYEEAEIDKMLPTGAAMGTFGSMLLEGMEADPTGPVALLKSAAMTVGSIGISAAAGAISGYAKRRK